MQVVKALAILMELSGRVRESSQRGHGFETHRRYCVVSLYKT